jgi:hypothetical protein
MVNFGSLRLSLPGEPDDRTHLVAARKRLLDHMSADSARGAEDEDSPRAC